MRTTKDTKTTAIKRNKLSSPLRWLIRHKPYYFKDKRCLDYGCGRGLDSYYAYLYHKIILEQYDPYWDFPLPTGKFDTIYCGYVLNVLNTSDRYNCIKKIENKLTKGGTAFLVVRRDIKVLEHQYMVYLELPVLHESTNKYCIYTLEKG